jgi:hypothetical protein
MSLTSLSQLGRIEKEIVLNESLKIKVHTLSVSEQQRALVSLPEGVENDVVKFTFLQSAILAQAIHEINGEKVTAEQTKELLENMQYNLMAYVFAEYTTLAGEQGKVLDELKKK